MSKVMNMTDGSPTRLMLKFALPVILTNLGQQLYQIVDAAIVGRGVGMDAPPQSPCRQARRHSGRCRNSESPLYPARGAAKSQLPCRPATSRSSEDRSRAWRSLAVRAARAMRSRVKDASSRGEHTDRGHCFRLPARCRFACQQNPTVPLQHTQKATPPQP